MFLAMLVAWLWGWQCPVVSWSVCLSVGPPLWLEQSKTSQQQLDGFSFNFIHTLMVPQGLILILNCVNLPPPFGQTFQLFSETSRPTWPKFVQTLWFPDNVL